MSDTEIIEGPPIWVKSPYFKKPLKWVGRYYYGDDARDIFANLVKRIAEKIADILEKDNQVMVVISGDTSTGKSTLALLIIVELCKILKYDINTSDYDSCVNLLKDVYVYEPADLAEKLDRGCTNRINWFDEGSVSLNSLETMTKGGRLFSKFFDSMRLRHFANFICIPEGKEVNARVVKHANLYIKCPKKAPFIGFEHRGFFHTSYKIKWDSGKEYDQFTGTGIYPKLPKKLKLAYEEVKRQHNAVFEKEFIEGVLKK